MDNMVNHGTGWIRLEYLVPARGLIGMRNEFLTETRGTGNPALGLRDVRAVARRDHHPCHRLAGRRPARHHRVPFALMNLQERGQLFVGPGEEVYEGMVIGENARAEDLDVNPTKGKQQTNIRAAGSDEAVRLVPHHRLSLDQALEFIRDDECVEVTPEAVRLRKVVLPGVERVKLARAGKRQARAISDG